MSKFSYFAYGLRISSSIEFPELKIEKTDSDIIIDAKTENTFPKGELVLDNPNGLSLVRYGNQDIGVLLENKTLFRVRYGKEIIININSTIDQILLRLLILNQGMGLLLNQRGYLVLHGSAVNINGKAIAFLGRSLRGKSTIAASLNIRGYPLITDDVLAINFNKNEPQILPSYPRIKLRDDILKLISTNNLKQIQANQNKYCYNANKNFSTNPLPLKNIYLIEKSHKNEINILKSCEALIELIKQSYTIKLFDNSEKYKNLIQCKKVVKNVHVKVLKRSDSIEEINNLLQKIEKDV